MKNPLPIAALAACLLTPMAHPSRAQTAAPAPASAPAAGAPSPLPLRVAEHYTKHEFRIPMRDGVRLFTVVHLPKDRSRAVPILMERTPYGVGAFGPEGQNYGVDFVGGALGPSDDFARAGYIFVRQDVRGRNMSEGRWTEMQPQRPVKNGPADTDASTDAYDTVEWLLKNLPGHNGRVGLWGNSYPGFYAAAGVIDGHPAIKAASPQAPIADMFMGDDSYHNGAFMLAANHSFYSAFKIQANPTLPEPWKRFEYGTPSGYDYFLRLGNLRAAAAALPPEARPSFNQQIDHATYDAFWKERNLAPHLKNVRAAVLTVGGWFDAEDPQGPLTVFESIERLNPGAQNHLVMGPWVHGGWLGRPGERIGAVRFDMPTAEQYRKRILFPFFERHLRGAEPPPGSRPPAKATVFETGTNRWREFDAWPPRQAEPRTLYLLPGGGLGFEPPPAAAGARAYDEWVSDPARPVPFLAVAATGVPQEYVVADQRFAATRPDVLVYQTPTLEQDVTIVGPIEPRLFVSTSGTDSDWVVKLIDVYPDRYPEPAEAASPRNAREQDVTAPPSPLAGYQQLVRGEPMRAKFRESFERPRPMVPGEVTRIEFRMPDVAHTFRRGHRIMVQLQSSWFPLVDRNPQSFVHIPDAAPGDFRAATQRVYRQGPQASGIALRVLPGI